MKFPSIRPLGPRGSAVIAAAIMVVRLTFLSLGVFVYFCLLIPPALLLVWLVVDTEQAVAVMRLSLLTATGTEVRWMLIWLFWSAAAATFLSLLVRWLGGQPMRARES